jgi:hypothetical protein
MDPNKEIILIKTKQIPGGQIHTLYDTSLTASGGNENTYTWSLISGELPGGIDFLGTGKLTGIPATKGDYQFRVKVTDNENQADTAGFSLYISDINISPYSLIPARKGEPYYEKLEISGGKNPYTCSLQSGTLPANLVLDELTGEITGDVTGESGIYPVTIEITDSQGSAVVKEYIVTVIDGDPVIITGSECPPGVVSNGYSYVPSATGGSGNYTWEAIAQYLPDGLSFNESGPDLSGIPLDAGTFFFILKARDRENPLNCHTIELPVTIYNHVQIMTDSCTSGIKDDSYSFQFSATGGTGVYSWEITQGELPPGLTFHNQTGIIDGIPAATGKYIFTIEAADTGIPGNTHSGNFTLGVYEKVEILPHTFPTLKGNYFFSETLDAQGGSGSYQWRITGNPDAHDISIGKETGIISGYPSRPGTSVIEVTCADTGDPGNYDIKTFQLEVENLEWTIIVYVDGDNNLEPYAFIDLNEMEAADIRGTGIKVIALVDGIDGYYYGTGNFTDTRLYEVMYDVNGPYLNTGIISRRLYSDELGITETGSTELNMADTETLANFITYTQNTFTAENYGLILWDHGDGWPSFPEPEKAPSRSIIFDTTSGNDKLAIKEVGDTLRGRDISFIGFDACLMNMVEVAYELKDCCEIMTGSEELESGDGWEYHILLDSFKQSEKTAYSLGVAAVSSYASYHYASDNVTLSVIDLTKMDDLAAALETFIIHLESSSFSNIYAKVAQGSGLQRFYSDYNPYYGQYMMSHIDLWDFAERLISIPGADDLLGILNETILYNYTSGDEMTGAHGISIYFPMVNLALAPSETEYRNAELSFLENSRWDEYIYNFWWGNDTHEPNDNFLTARKIQQGETLEGYIQFYSTQDAPPDTDLFHFSVGSNRNVRIKVDLHGNSFLDLVLELYTGSNETTLIRRIDTGGYGGNEELTYYARTGYEYYIRVYEKNKYVFDRAQYYSVSLF